MGHVLIKDLCKEFIQDHPPRGLMRHVSNNDVQQDNVVLDHVNLEFQDGEMVCILGPSGCGKTTLVRIIAGFDRPSAGSVHIDGKEVAGPSPNNIFVFQHSGLLPWLTVWENCCMGLRKMKDKDEMASRVQEYIDVVNLSGFEHYYPHQLSGGMQRRAELARALVVNPELLFMDEPFAGLDFLTRLKLREEIVNMHEFLCKTVLFITHDIDEALVMADRLVVFSDRPANVKVDVKLDFPRPRDFQAEAGLDALRKEVYQELGVHFAL